MSKQFKAGDKVRAVETDTHNKITEGYLYEVKRVEPAYRGNLIYVVLDNGDVGGVYAKRFELVSHNKFEVRSTPLQVGGFGIYVLSASPRPHYDTEAEARTWVTEQGQAEHEYEIVEIVPRAKLTVKTARTVTEVCPQH